MSDDARLRLTTTERRHRRRFWHRARRRGDAFWPQVWAAVVSGIVLVVLTNGATYAYHRLAVSAINHNWRVYSRQLDDRIISLNREVAILKTTR